MTEHLPLTHLTNRQVLPAAAIPTSDIIAVDAELFSPQTLDELWDLLNADEQGRYIYSTDDAVFQTEEEESLFWTTVNSEVSNTSELPFP